MTILILFMVLLAATLALPGKAACWLVGLGFDGVTEQRTERRA